MSVRPRRDGDSIRIIGRDCTKSLKKLFIEQHIPARNREIIPVIADENGVLAVYGLCRGDRATPEPGDMAVMLKLYNLEENDEK